MTGVQTCALPIYTGADASLPRSGSIHRRTAGWSPGISCSQHGPGDAPLTCGDLENIVSFTVWLRSSLFFGGMVASILVFWPISMVSWVLPIVQRMRVIGAWAWFINRWLGATCGLRYEVSGLENLPQQPGVILSKHQSAWETIVFQDRKSVGSVKNVDRGGRRVLVLKLVC